MDSTNINRVVYLTGFQAINGNKYKYSALMETGQRIRVPVVCQQEINPKERFLAILQKPPKGNSLSVCEKDLIKSGYAAYVISPVNGENIEDSVGLDPNSSGENFLYFLCHGDNIPNLDKITGRHNLPYLRSALYLTGEDAEITAYGLEPSEAPIPFESRKPIANVDELVNEYTRKYNPETVVVTIDDKLDWNKIIAIVEKRKRLSGVQLRPLPSKKSKRRERGKYRR